MTKLSTGTLNKYIYVACKIFFDIIYYYNELFFTNHNIISQLTFLENPLMETLKEAMLIEF